MRTVRNESCKGGLASAGGFWKTVCAFTWLDHFPRNLCTQLICLVRSSLQPPVCSPQWSPEEGTLMRSQGVSKPAREDTGGARFPGRSTPWSGRRRAGPRAVCTDSASRELTAMCHSKHLFSLRDPNSDVLSEGERTSCFCLVRTRTRLRGRDLEF